MRITASIGRIVGSLVGGTVAGFRESLTPSATTTRGGGYAGGRSDRRNDNWSPGNAGPNAVADLTLAELRNRCRDLARNHPQLAGAVNSIVTSVVGHSGIRVRPMTEWTDLNDQIRRLLRTDLLYVDPGRTITERVYQSELMIELIAAGELLTHFGYAGPWGRHSAGPCMESVVAERIDLGLNSSTGERIVRQGVELDAQGRTVRYHVYKSHPNDGGFMVGVPYLGSRSMIELDAFECSMAMLRRQAGQVRGVPLAAPVVHELAFGKKVKDAALMSALSQACIGLTVTGGTPDKMRDKIGESTELKDGDGNSVRKLVPGLVTYLPKGVDIEFHSPNLPGPSFESMTALIDRENAAALGQDIAGYSKDFGKATFSSIRADQLSVHRTYRFFQQLIFESQAQPWYEIKLEHWIAQGMIELSAEQREAWADPRERCRILHCGMQSPGFGWVDPKQEATAADLAIKAGIRSRPDIIAEYGDDPEETLREQIAFEALEKELRKEAGLATGPVAPAAPAPGSQDPNEDPDRHPDDPPEDEEESGRDGSDAHAMIRRAKAGAAPHTNGVARHA